MSEPLQFITPNNSAAPPSPPVVSPAPAVSIPVVSTPPMAVPEPLVQAEVLITAPAAAPETTVIDNTYVDDHTAVAEPVHLDPPANVKTTMPYLRASAGEFDNSGKTETIFMPSATPEGTLQRIRDLPKINLESGKGGREWLGAVNVGMESCVAGGGLVATVNDPDSMWAQEIDSEAGALRSGKVNFKSKPGQALSNDKVRASIRKSLRLGDYSNTALWHSGFWVRFQAPSEASLLELYRVITAEKISLGRSTYGLLFSNMTSYTTRVLLDFCVENIYETSLNLAEDDDVRKYIKTTDLQILFWGLACSIWSNGTQYTRACIADPSKCKHVVKEVIDLDGLQRTNSKQLTAWQIRHMTKRARNAMSVDDVARYVGEFTKGQPRKVDLDDEGSVSITLRVPNALEHIEAGYRWISAIEENYGRALTLDETKRDEYLMSQGRATLMRNYSHFVEAIHFDGQSYTDTELIEDTLEDLTSSDSVRARFGKEIAKYIDDATISLIAIEAYDCPACGKPQRSPMEKDKFPDLIPMDVSQHFFQLVLQRLRKVEQR